MKLLYAEDEPALSEAVVDYLTYHKYIVDAVYDGADAYDYAMSGEYDGIILDIMMPKRDGISALKELRARGIDIPVLILSAKAEIDDKVLGLDCGANDYLTKPFSFKELLARLRAITRKGESQLDSTLKIGNITLDLATYELSAQGGSVKLANKEFQMMEMLMRNPTHLISTERFMEKIWGYDSDAEINVVWVYISYLRRKLTKIGARVEIRAHRNAGYSLEVT